MFLLSANAFLSLCTARCILRPRLITLAIHANYQRRLRP
jgi:hypothetical protein